MDEWIQHYTVRLKACRSASEIYKALNDAYHNPNVTVTAYKHLKWYAEEKHRELDRRQ